MHIRMVIVAAVDQSDRATLVAEEAESLAEGFDDTVHIVHALKRSEFLDSGLASSRTDRPVDAEEIRKAAAETAEDAAGNLNISYESVGLIGNPADEVVKYADEQDTRYIVVSPRKRSRAGKALFGSTAQSILLNTTCPVVSTLQNW